MLVIQSSYKSDLETGRSIFILYMQNNDGMTYNCSLDYNIIKNAQSSGDVLNALIPLLRNLCDITFNKPVKLLTDVEEARKDELIRNSVNGLNENEKKELTDLISKSQGYKEQVKEEVSQPETIY